MLLNLGCGRTFHADWVNLDLEPADSRVRQADLTKGIPLESESCIAVYHSHVLEHMSADEGLLFLTECYRVLRAGGVIRVVVPDLEQIARLYLSCFESAQTGVGLDRLEWMRLELLDQVGRCRPGGEMLKRITAAQGDERVFIRERVGQEATRVWEAPPPEKDFFAFARRLQRATPRRVWRRLRLLAAENIAALLGGSAFRDAFREGAFRHSGEVHRCMYDRVSLAHSLQTVGFSDPRVCRADQSAIPDFTRYELDMTGGAVRKPDSLFMEARRPTERGTLQAPGRDFENGETHFVRENISGNLGSGPSQ